MRLELEVTVDAGGRFEGSFEAPASPPVPFSGTLHLLEVLEQLVSAAAPSSEPATG